MGRRVIGGTWNSSKMSCRMLVRGWSMQLGRSSSCLELLVLSLCDFMRDGEFAGQFR